MPIDKTWTTIENRNSLEFEQGLEAFVERSKSCVDDKGQIRCPCQKCLNCGFVSISVMKAHIHRFGFCRHYITWVYHGESRTPSIMRDGPPSNEMADIMARGHDGDGHEDPPPSPGGLHGQHEMDVVPPRRRGKAKNRSLSTMWNENNKQPLTLEFDEITSTTVGEVHDAFIREVGMYIWRNISLDRESWSKVSLAEKNAMFEHLRPYFDISRAMSNLNHKKGLECMFASRFRGRKGKAKEYFMRNGGYEDLQRARDSCLEDMTSTNWNKALNFFTTESYKKRSTQNKVNRGKQAIKNRGGTSSYSSACFKKNINRLQVFREAQINKQGAFYDPTIEAQYNNLVRAIAEQTQPGASSSNPNEVDWISIFDNVLGFRRGHIKGIGHRIGGKSPELAYIEQQSQSERDQIINAMFENPTFREKLEAMIRSFSNQIQNENTRNDVGEEDEDNQE